MPLHELLELQIFGLWPDLSVELRHLQALQNKDLTELGRSDAGKSAAAHPQSLPSSASSKPPKGRHRRGAERGL